MLKRKGQNTKQNVSQFNDKKKQNDKPQKKDIKFIKQSDENSKRPKLRKYTQVFVKHLLLFIVFASLALFAIQFIVANTLSFLDTAMMRLDTQTDPLIFMTVVASIAGVLSGGFIYVLIPKLYKLSLIGIDKLGQRFTKES